MRIAFGTDHAGYELKEKLVEHIRSLGHEAVDFGAMSADRCDYPDFVIPAAEAAASGDCDCAIVLGGSGNGEAIAANKVRGIRCAVVWNESTGQLAKQHNNANVISFGARQVTTELAIKIVDAWLGAEFEGDRHVTRIEKIAAYEAS